jgi:cellulose synthase (UDP-forming)
MSVFAPSAEARHPRLERPSLQDAQRSHRWMVARQYAIRILIVICVLLGIRYLSWRFTSSINWTFWPLAFLLLAAETFSFIDTLLLGTTMWNWRRRGAPPPPRGDETVDVFITCYNEPVELVRETVRAAIAIRHPHQTFVLDDGESPEMRRMAEEEGAHYIVRSTDWQGRERHAKAGNLNNALFKTSGDFILIQDADQIPAPDILGQTLGYFRDPAVAFVQTPQWFRNVPANDPFGSQAPLFYGPIQEGKDGWNAAFFCGSNAVLRREALFQAGLVNFASDLDLYVRRLLRRADHQLSQVERTLWGRGHRAERAAVRGLRAIVQGTMEELRAGEQLSVAIARFDDRVHDLAGVGLEVLSAGPDGPPTSPRALLRADLAALVAGDDATRDLAERRGAPLSSVAVALTMARGAWANEGHAASVMPIATISVTEDMATAMRIHALGWKSVFHPVILAEGLAPDDLGSVMQQRLRWAQGTIQVMLRENPLLLSGLTVGQRLSYFATMWSYLSGFITVIYLAAPVLYLVLGWSPVVAFSGPFFQHLIPYLIANQLLFLVISWGLSTWRGQQYNVALFPVWIKAVVSAGRSVWSGKDLSFLVTPKERNERVSPSIVWPQLTAIALLAVAVLVGLGRLAFGVDRADVVPVVVNVLWALYDIAALSVIFGALAYRPIRAARSLMAAPAAPAAPAPAAVAVPAVAPAVAASYEGFGAGRPGEF